EDAQVVVVYPLSNTPADELAETLAATLDPFDGSVAPDPRTNALIVSGTAAVQSAAEVLIGALDRDAAVGDVLEAPLP
ncbi:MAG: secretin N-terminal domain-containing protein, partial [Phycisphaerales bacterium JB041]